MPQAEPTSAQNVSNVALLPSAEASPPTVAPSRDALRLLPDHVLTTKVFTYFGFKDYALTGCACTYAHAHWQAANRRKPLPLYVPEDCKTLREAVARVAHDPRITTIVLGEGEHVVEVLTDEQGHVNNITGVCLEILSAMKIVGDPGVPKEKIVVVGRIFFKTTN